MFSDTRTAQVDLKRSITESYVIRASYIEVYMELIKVRGARRCGWPP
jgi:hypothetical protein